MKTQSKLLAVMCAVWCMSAFMGCDTGFHDSKSDERKGAVRIIVDNGQTAQTDSRTVVPAGHDFAYTLTFTTPGKLNVTAEIEGSAGQVFLDAGTWTLAVVGKTWGDAAAESDSIPVTVPPEDDPITVSVIMHPILNGGDGIFLYRINAGEAVTDVSAALTPLNVGDADQDETVLTIGEWFGQTLSVAPGYTGSRSVP
jgi:hypothetical protein